MGELLERLPELRSATGDDDQVRLGILSGRILDVEIDNRAVCEYQVMQQGRLAKVHHELTTGKDRQIVRPVGVCPLLDMSRFDGNDERLRQLERLVGLPGLVAVALLCKQFS